MRLHLTRITTLEQYWTTVGCIACRQRPTRLYLINDEAEPSAECTTCGRYVVTLIRRYSLIPGAEVDGQVG